MAGWESKGTDELNGQRIFFFIHDREENSSIVLFEMSNLFAAYIQVMVKCIKLIAALGRDTDF